MFVFFFGHWHIIFLLSGKFFQTFFVCLNPTHTSCLILDNHWGSLDKSQLTLTQQAMLTKFLLCSLSTSLFYLNTYTHNITFKMPDSLFNSIPRLKSSWEQGQCFAQNCTAKIGMYQNSNKHFINKCLGKWMACFNT